MMIDEVAKLMLWHYLEKEEENHQEDADKPDQMRPNIERLVVFQEQTIIDYVMKG